MKFYFIVLFAMSVLFGNVFAADEEVVLESSYPQTVVLEVGKVVNVVISEYQGTGNSWVANVTTGEDKIEEVGDSEYYREFVSKHGYRMGGSVRVFQYRALEEGESRISFYLVKGPAPSYGSLAPPREVIVRVEEKASQSVS